MADDLSEIVALQTEIIADLTEQVKRLTATPTRPRRNRRDVMRRAPEDLKEKCKVLHDRLKELSDVFECDNVQTSLMEPTPEFPHWGYVIWNGPANGQGRTTYKFSDWDRVQDWLDKKVQAAEAARRRALPGRATIAEISAH